MKQLLLLLLLFPSLSFGQKYYCKKIKKTTQQDVTIYKSPEQMHLSVIKQSKRDSFFCVRLCIRDGKEHFDATGAEIHFQDGTVLTDAGAKVNCQEQQMEVGSGYASNSPTAGYGAYVMQGFFHINETNIEKFASKKITMVTLHNVPQAIPDKEATNIRAFIKCMRDMR